MNAFENIQRSLRSSYGMVIAFGGTMAIYLFTAWFILLPGEIWSPDEGAKLWQLESLRIENGRLQFNLPYKGGNIDPRLDYALAGIPSEILRVVNGQLTFQRLPIFPLLTWPFYQTVGLRGIYILPALAGALLCVLTMALISPKQRRVRMWLVIAFGSPVFIYSVLFWEHTLAACLAMMGVGLVFREVRREKMGKRSVLAWLLASGFFILAMYLRLEVSLLSMALLVAVWLQAPEQRRMAAMMTAMLLLALAIYRPVHAAVLAGQPAPTNARYIFRPFLYLHSAGWNAIPDLLVGPAVDEAIDPGWLGGLWAISAILAVAHGDPHRIETRRLRQISLALCLVCAGYFLLTPEVYRSAHGLLFTTPWLVLGVSRAAEVSDTGDRRLRLITMTALLGAIFYAVAVLMVRGSSPHGGLEWGARFFLPFYPLFAILAAWEDGHHSRLDRTFIFLLILVSFGFQGRGLITIQGDKIIHRALNRALVTAPEEHILTDLWWLNLVNVASETRQKAIYTASDVYKMASWVRLAHSHAIDQFLLVTLDYAAPTRLASQLPDQTIYIEQFIQVERLLIYRISIH